MLALPPRQRIKSARELKATRPVHLLADAGGSFRIVSADIGPGEEDGKSTRPVHLHADGSFRIVSSANDTIGPQDDGGSICAKAAAGATDAEMAVVGGQRVSWGPSGSAEGRFDGLSVSPRGAGSKPLPSPLLSPSPSSPKAATTGLGGAARRSSSLCPLTAVAEEPEAEAARAKSYLEAALGGRKGHTVEAALWAKGHPEGHLEATLEDEGSIGGGSGVIPEEGDAETVPRRAEGRHEPEAGMGKRSAMEVAEAAQGSGTAEAGAVHGNGTADAGSVQSSGTAEVGAVHDSGTAQAIPRWVFSAEIEADDVDAMPEVKAAGGGASQLEAEAGRSGGTAGGIGKMSAMEVEAARLLAAAGAALRAGEGSGAPREVEEEECRSGETRPGEEAAWAYEENGVFGRVFAADAGDSVTLGIHSSEDMVLAAGGGDLTPSSEVQWEDKDAAFGAAAAAAGDARGGAAGDAGGSVGGDVGGGAVGDAKGGTAGSRPAHSVVLVGLWDAVAAAGSGADGGGTGRYGGHGFSAPEPTVLQRMQQGFVDGMHGVRVAVTHGVTQDIHEVWGGEGGRDPARWCVRWTFGPERWRM